MRKITVASGLLIGAISSFAVMGILYLGAQLAVLPFVPFDVFDWLARVLPGNVVTAGIDTIVGAIGILGLDDTDSSAKLIEQLLALALFVIGGALLGGIIAGAVRRQARAGPYVGAGAGLLFFLIVAAIELASGIGSNPWLAVVCLALVLIGWGALLGYFFQPATRVMNGAESRRALLLRFVASSAGIALATWGAGRLLAMDEDASGAGQPLANQAGDLDVTETPVATPSAEAEATVRERVPAVPGTRSEVTPNEDFYRIDINITPPTIDGDSWVLETAGLFESPRPLTLNDLTALPAVTQPITLSCISNQIGGDLISTSNWTGVRLRDLVDELGMLPETQEISLQAEDGFYESVVMEDVMDPRTLLVYGMNGETLPVEHGFPLRIYIPDRYGMKQPKWIIRMEAIDHEGEGYWVERGWSEEARPHIISMIDTVAENAVTAQNEIPIGGIAWAGDRGIQKVEVQVDDGAWTEAILRTPPLSGLTWITWRYNWPLEAGEHRFRVRAVDGTGMTQVGEETGVRPDGATGYHAVTTTI